MSTRMGLSRALEFFRNASLDECEFVLAKAKKIYDERLAAQRKSAKSQADAAGTPRRKRRTKQQIAEDEAKQVGKQVSIEEGARAAGAAGTVTV